MDKPAGTAVKAMTKTEIIQALTEATSLSKQQVACFLDELAKLIARNIGAGGPGEFTLPGLAKIKVARKAATPERKGINPFTKQEQIIKAKPARNVVKVQPLKALKDMA